MVEWVYGPVIVGMKGGFAALGLRFVERGYENMPRTGGAVLAINHIGYFDFIFAGKPADPIGRYVRFMAKDVVFRHKVAGPLMRGMKHIPVDREAGAGAYAAAVTSLRNGELVGVFPEGTTSRSYTIKQFKTGAARMAADAGCRSSPSSPGVGSGSTPRATNPTSVRGTRPSPSLSASPSTSRLTPTPPR